MSMAVHLTDASALKEKVPFEPRPENLDERWTPEAARDAAERIDKLTGPPPGFASLVKADPHQLSKLLLGEQPRQFLVIAAKLKLSTKKSGFLIQGEDRPGAVAEVFGKLAQANINATAMQVFCAGGGRYGGMLWVKSPDLRKAAKALGAA
jgi:hypothetical protein